MAKRLNKKLRKNNKVVEKDLFASNADIEFENSAFEKTTYFDSFDEITGVITEGSYEYDKKGRVDSYSLRLPLAIYRSFMDLR